MKPVFIALSIIVLVDAYVIEGDVEQGSYSELPEEYRGIADAMMNDNAPGGYTNDNRYNSDGGSQDGNYNPRPQEAYSQGNDVPYNNYQDVDGQDSYPNMRQNNQEGNDRYKSDGNSDEFSINGNSINDYGRQGGSDDDMNMLYGNDNVNQYGETDGGNQGNTGRSGYGEQNPGQYDNTIDGSDSYGEQNQDQYDNKIDGSDSYSDNINNSTGKEGYENKYSDGNCQAADLPSVKPFEVTMNTGPNNPYPKGQCTEWADGRTYQLKGVHVNFNGDAHLWNDIASNDPQWQVSDQPTVGSMMILEQGTQGVSDVTGHVAIVESFSGSSVCTSNWNFPTLGQTTYKTLQTGPGVSFISYSGLVGIHESYK